MARQEKTDLKKFASEQLQEELNSSEAAYRRLKYDHAASGIQNPLEIRALRRNIARIHTEMRTRSLAEASLEELVDRERIRNRRRNHK